MDAWLAQVLVWVAMSVGSGDASYAIGVDTPGDGTFTIERAGCDHIPPAEAERAVCAATRDDQK